MNFSDTAVKKKNPTCAEVVRTVYPNFLFSFFFLLFCFNLPSLTHRIIYFHNRIRQSWKGLSNIGSSRYVKCGRGQMLKNQYDVEQ